MPADKTAMIVPILSTAASDESPEPENQANGPVCGCRIHALITVAKTDAIAKLVIGRLAKKPFIARPHSQQGSRGVHTTSWVTKPVQALDPLTWIKRDDSPTGLALYHENAFSGRIGCGKRNSDALRRIIEPEGRTYICAGFDPDRAALIAYLPCDSNKGHRHA